MSDKHARLVETLLVRTERGLVRWRPGLRERETVVDLSTTSIALEEVDGEAGASITLTLFDGLGRPVETIGEDAIEAERPGADMRGKLDRLYRMARRTSLDADRVLDEALGELESGLVA